MIRRKRAAPDGIEIPDELHRTTRGEDFLAHHDEEQDITQVFLKRIVIGLQMVHTIVRQISTNYI